MKLQFNPMECVFNWVATASDFFGDFLKLDQTTPQNIINGNASVIAPTSDLHIANKKYVDDADALLVPYTGATANVALGIRDITAGNLSGDNTGDQDLSHTGEVTGTTQALTVDKTSISNQSDTVILAGDIILFGDASDTGNLKKDTVQGILDLVPSPTGFLLDTTDTFTGVLIVDGSIIADTITGSNSATLNITTPNSTTPNDLTFKAANCTASNGAINGGAFNITAGNAGANGGYSAPGVGGQVNVTAGNGGTSSGANTRGGHIVMLSGNGAGQGYGADKGGDFIMTSGEGGIGQNGAGTGGNFYMTSGKGTAPSSSGSGKDGGNFYISGGEGSEGTGGSPTDGAGGSVYLEGGIGFPDGEIHLLSNTNLPAVVMAVSLPTSASGLATGQIWNNSGVLNVA